MKVDPGTGTIHIDMSLDDRGRLHLATCVTGSRAWLVAAVDTLIVYGKITPAELSMAAEHRESLAEVVDA